ERAAARVPPGGPDVPEQHAPAVVAGRQSRPVRAERQPEGLDPGPRFERLSERLARGRIPQAGTSVRAGREEVAVAADGDRAKVGPAGAADRADRLPRRGVEHLRLFATDHEAAAVLAERELARIDGPGCVEHLPVVRGEV